jgi:steroid 5-alpha reductase family enzyme
MFNLTSFLTAGGILLAAAILLWLVSLQKRDVSIVDSFWSLMILLSGLVFFISTEQLGERSYLVFTLAVIWAIRLSAYISWRNRGKPEDFRYQQIRANNEPYFNYKSLYIVFGLQAVLAWIVSLPLLSAIDSQGSSDSDLYWLDYLALALWLFGMFFEVIGDAQLARFKADAANKGKVMAQGLWRYTRHPNYFGEFCIWWAFFIFALAAGYWWSIISPVLMSLLLLKVSGVSLLEKDIHERRPAYAQYRQRTSAFFPWWPKTIKPHSQETETA